MDLVFSLMVNDYIIIYHLFLLFIFFQKGFWKSGVRCLVFLYFLANSSIQSVFFEKNFQYHRSIISVTKTQVSYIVWSF